MLLQLQKIGKMRYKRCSNKQDETAKTQGKENKNYFGDWLFALICFLCLILLRVFEPPFTRSYYRKNSAIMIFLIALSPVLWLRGRKTLVAFQDCAKSFNKWSEFKSYYKSGELFYVMLIILAVYSLIFLLDLKSWDAAIVMAGNIVIGVVLKLFVGRILRISK